jgi:methyltransferase
MSGQSVLYLAFVLLAVLVASLERLHAARNERRLRGRGADEVAPWVFRLMVPAYAAVFLGAVGEHLLLHRRPPLPLATAAVVLFVASKSLKLWAVLHLGDAWTMRVFLPRVLRVVTTGPYRYVRHPNYVAVVGEVVAVPLAGGAWITAGASVVLFAVILAMRVKTEERALLARPEYAVAMASKRRFLPGGGG